MDLYKSLKNWKTAKQRSEQKADATAPTLGDATAPNSTAEDATAPISTSRDAIVPNSSANDTEVFEEQKFKNYFIRMKCRYKDISSKERPITEDMYDNTTRVVEVPLQQLQSHDGYIIQQLNTGTKEQKQQQQGTTKLSQAFPIGSGTKRRLTAVIGTSGAGKTVYSLTLNSYYIKHGFYVFNLDLQLMSQCNDRLSFPDFIIKFSCPSFPRDTSQKLDVWLRENADKCVFLIDGIPTVSSNMKIAMSYRGHSADGEIILERRAKNKVWMLGLFHGDIMPQSKIILTTNRESVVSLVQYNLLPDLVYSLNGLSDEGIEQVVKMYNEESVVQEIVNFIKSDSPEVVKSSRNPLLVSLISLVYKAAPPTTAD